MSDAMYMGDIWLGGFDQRLNLLFGFPKIEYALCQL